MFMNVYLYDGDPKYTLQYGGDSLDAATMIDNALVNPLQNFPYYCHFNAAANAGLVAGVTLTGQTSGAVIKVGKVVLTQGAVASAGMGILFYTTTTYDSARIVSGENLRVGNTTYCVALSGHTDAPMSVARSIFITAETNTIRYCVGGATPTNAGATPASFGVPLTAGQSIVLSSPHELYTFSMINAASGSNAVVNIIVCF